MSEKLEGLSIDMAEKSNGLSCKAMEKIEELFKKNENIKVVGLLDI